MIMEVAGLKRRPCSSLRDAPTGETEWMTLIPRQMATSNYRGGRT